MAGPVRILTDTSRRTSRRTDVAASSLREGGRVPPVLPGAAGIPSTPMVFDSHVTEGGLPRPDEVSTLTRLEAERVRVLNQLTGLRRGFQETIDASADSNADDEHDPEGPTIAFERSQLATLIHQAERHLDDIEEARMRVASGRYGLCETCGKPVAMARLDALPVARRCFGCASRR